MKPITYFLLLTILFACDIQHEEVQAPPRPESVPATALWIGGPDGGVFVKVSMTKVKNIYFGTIYFDSNGEICYQGPFRYTGDDAFEVDDKSSYSGWDGDYLFLTNHEKLIAIDTNE